jgi:hypothetical protein
MLYLQGNNPYPKLNHLKKGKVMRYVKISFVQEGNRKARRAERKEIMEAVKKHLLPLGGHGKLILGTQGERFKWDNGLKYDESYFRVKCEFANVTMAKIRARDLSPRRQ